MKVIYTVIVAIIVLFIITFSLENTAPVKLGYHGFDFFKRSLPTYMLIFLSFLAGVIFTGFMGIVERFRLTRTINRLNKTIRDLRREMKANESEHKSNNTNDNGNPPCIEVGEKTTPPSSEASL
jgi:uncharacterized integral membrane protein